MKENYFVFDICSGITSGIVWCSTFVSSLLIVFLCIEVGIVEN